MRGPGFLRFNEHKKHKAQTPSPWPSPPGGRGDSRRSWRSRKWRRLAVSFVLSPSGSDSLHKRFALLIAQEQLSYAGRKQNDFVFQSLFDQRILQGYELRERVA